VQNPDCGNCHLGYTASSVVSATHDGKVDVKRLEATVAMIRDERRAPIGTAGETDTQDLAVGAHQQHLHDGTIRSRLSCTDRTLLSRISTPTAPSTLAWGALATGGGA
jgi:hypothetical protein